MVLHAHVSLLGSTLSLLFRRVWFSNPLSRYWTYPRVRVSESDTHDSVVVVRPPCLPAALSLLPARYVAVSIRCRVEMLPYRLHAQAHTLPRRYIAWWSIHCLVEMLPRRPHAQAPTTSFLRLNLRISLTNSVPTDFFGLILGGSHQPPFFISAIPESMRSRSSP